MDLAAKVVVITGGGQGLGRAMAISIASKGAKLALVDLNDEPLNETVQLCQQAGGSAIAYKANIADEAQVETLFNDIVNDLGSVDACINNAGIIRDSQMLKVKNGVIEKRMTMQQWQSVMDVNLTGVFLCGREAATKMVEAKTGGVLINISSIARAGNFGQTNYSAAKAGVAAMAVTWAKELSKFGIRSAAIAPGFIATDMVRSMPAAALEAMAKDIPLKRIGEMDEIAQTALFILENDYINGRVIETDGGLRL